MGSRLPRIRIGFTKMCSVLSENDSRWGKGYSRHMTWGNGRWDLLLDHWVGGGEMSTSKPTAAGCAMGFPGINAFEPLMGLKI